MCENGKESERERARTYIEIIWELSIAEKVTDQIDILYNENQKYIYITSQELTALITT